MQSVERHGGGSHFVRPDRVYRTGVLSSTMGYDPGADVQSVAASFTQYPMDLSLPSGLGGYLGAAGNIGLINKLRFKFSAWRSRKKAQAFMQGMHHDNNGRGQPDSIAANAAYARIGEELSPSLASKEAILANLMQGSLPNNYARAQAATSWHRWSNPWWNA